MAQDEDLGRWVTAQRYGFDQLVPAQQWLLGVLGIEAAEAEERPVKRATAVGTRCTRHALVRLAVKHLRGITT
ncbi:hypothetical protein [Streptomyces sp. NPDC049813]|uniref:hypothetical protein n=1 Tax=Streptomyces sp. NPDC049813 TaxID=3365597 RepID=UPI00378F7417